MNTIRTMISGRNYAFEYDESVWPMPAHEWDCISVFRVGIEGSPEEVCGEVSKVVEMWNTVFWDEWIRAGIHLQMALFVASPVSVLPGAISRYNRLWKTFKKSYPAIQSLSEKSEIECSVSSKEVRYVGICEVPNEIRVSGFDLMRHQTAIGGFACGLRTKDEYEVMTESIYHRALRDHNNEHLLNWPEFVSTILQHNGLALRLFGPPDFGGLYIDSFVKAGTKEEQTLLNGSSDFIVKKNRGQGTQMDI